MCKYCEDKYELIPNSKGQEMQICKNEENYTLDLNINGMDENIFIEVEMEYCFKCGGKLEV